MGGEGVGGSDETFLKTFKKKIKSLNLAGLLTLGNAAACEETGTLKASLRLPGFTKKII